MNKKRVLIAVTTDIVSDMRVQKVCSFLLEKGLELNVIGRVMPSTFKANLPFKYKLFKLIFKRGALFYAEYMIRFFFFGLVKRTEIIVANDLDTLLPCYLLSKLKRIPLVYDSHEYFTESAGLIGKKRTKWVWELVEKKIFPSLKRISTVNDSIAFIYKKKYNVNVYVVRNIPPFYKVLKTKSKLDFGISESKKVILLQGGYIDFDRGGIELIESMQFVSDDFLLLVIGAGQEIPRMIWMMNKLKLNHKIQFIPKIPSEALLAYTNIADLGISIDKPTNLNYTYSLPNKLFDYMRAEVPMLISSLPELVKIHTEFPFGLILDSHKPKHIAQKIQEALYHPDYEQWKVNLSLASESFRWENECESLKELYRDLW